MKIRIIPSAIDAREDIQYLSSYLVNDSIAIDAGSIGIYRTAHDQCLITHIFLTHAHIDHIGSLPILADNTYGMGRDCIYVLGSPETLRAVKANLFNDKIWPSFFLRPLPEGGYVVMETLEPEKPVTVSDLTFTAVPVQHSVDTYGYIVEDKNCAVIFGADSGPTSRIWEIARNLAHLKAVFLEASFPNDMNELAVKTGHLTPMLLDQEVKKLPANTRIIATHIKLNFRSRVVEELSDLKLANLEIGSTGREYSF